MGVETRTRCTFMFDEDTMRDLQHMRRALRATSASEAARFCVRKVAELSRAVGVGDNVWLVSPGNGRARIDLPGLEEASDGKKKAVARIRAQKRQRQGHRS